MPRRLFLCFSLGLSVVAALSGTPAQAETFKSRYTISYLGLPVAQSRFTTRFEGDRFAVEGAFSSSGLARIFDTTQGTARISGRFADGRAQPNRYEIAYSEGDKKKRTAVNFADGNVVKTENVPPLRDHKDRVAVRAADLRAVADPLSATLVRAPSLDAVCPRTIRLFDGEIRADLVLSEGEREDWNGREAVTCRARFVPVSGYRKGKKAIAYLRDKGAISITFAALARSGVYAPVHASVGTQIGTVTISAND